MRTEPVARINVGIDKSFTVQEKNDIFEALIRWQDGTNGLVLFHIGNMHLDRLIMHTDDKTTWYSINIIKAYSAYKVVQAADESLQLTINGLAYRHPKAYWALIIVDRIKSKNEFIGLVMHEIGHLLGLEHQSGHNVMYKYSGRPSYVTAKDLRQLTKYWNKLTKKQTENNTQK